ncbi:MAG: hypothetical protein CMJ36_00930 [Phycisphaerae bacterium]|nr:hypothetical protein [Phycisphaerae bacterium]
MPIFRTGLVSLLLLHGAVAGAQEGGPEPREHVSETLKSGEHRPDAPGRASGTRGPVPLHALQPVSSAAGEDADDGPVVAVDPNAYIVPPPNEPFRFLQEGVDLVSSLAGELNLSFVPQMVYVYQHAEHSNGQHGFSHIFTNINGAMPFWATEDDPTGHLLYNVQGNSGVGASSYPFINEFVGSPYFIDNVLTRSRLSLKKLWWQQDLIDGVLKINVGKLYYANFFDMNAGAEDPTRQYLAAQLSNNTAVPFSSYGFGAVGQWNIDEESLLRFGSMNALASGVSTGFEDLDEGRFFNMAQYNWMPKLQINGEKRQGHYRGFVWYSNNDIDYEKKGWGVGLSFDQDIGGGLTPFLRWGIAQEGAAPADMCWSSGITVNGVFGRAHDGVGIGFCFSRIEGGGLDDGRLGDGWETIVEAFWRIQVTRTLQVSPDIQWFRSGEVDGVGDTWIWGLRCTWNF